MQIGWTDYANGIASLTQFLQILEPSAAICLTNPGSSFIRFVDPNQFARLQRMVNPGVVLSEISNPRDLTSCFSFPFINLSQASILQKSLPVRSLGEGPIMGDQKQGGFLLRAGFQQKLHDLFRCSFVEISRRLVRQDHFGVD